MLGWAHEDFFETQDFSTRTLKEGRLKEKRSMRAWMERLIQVAAERGAFNAIRYLDFATDNLRLGVTQEHDYAGQRKNFEQKYFISPASRSRYNCFRLNSCKRSKSIKDASAASRRARCRDLTRKDFFPFGLVMPPLLERIGDNEENTIEIVMNAISRAR